MKKKGLLLSTIVMVVVLVVSLSTATFAWFSSQAVATIENINVNTVASDGLQIAVKQGNLYYSGDLGFDKDNSAFSGSAGWGTLLDFASITSVEGEGGTLGIMDDAITEYIKEGDGSQAGKVYKAYAIKVGDMQGDALTNGNPMNESAVIFTIGTNGGNAAFLSISSTNGNNVFSATTTYYELDTTVAVGDFIVPLAYNTNIEPVGYKLARSNEEYLDLPISVKSSKAVTSILCTLTVTPQTLDGAYSPHMAAATRIEISNNFKLPNEEVVTTQTIELEPYSAYIMSPGVGMFVGGQAKEPQPFVFNFVVATGSITASNLFDMNYTIWVEGTDGESINNAAGETFTVGLDYKFTEVGEGVVIPAPDVNVDKDASALLTTEGSVGTNNGQAMGGVDTAGYILFGDVRYYTTIITKAVIPPTA